MKKCVIIVLLALGVLYFDISCMFFISQAFAKVVSVRGSIAKSGVVKQPHFRTSPNSTKLDNWSTKGNVNPFTGKKGTTNPYNIKTK